MDGTPHDPRSTTRDDAAAAFGSGAEDRRMQRVLEALPVATWLLDPHGRILFGNEAGWGLHGCGAELRSRSSAWWTDDGPASAEGSWSLAPLVDSASAPTRESRGLRGRDGSALHVLRTTAPLVERDRVTGVIVVEQDVTALLQRQEHLREAHAMEVIGRLAAGIAHDFNNLLTAMLTYSDLALQGLPAGHAVRTDIEHARLAAERAGALTHQLLEFARKQLIAPVVLELPPRLAHVEDMLRRLLGERIGLTVRCDAGTWPVKFDEVQLERVLVNLAVNARDAMPDGGSLTISTRNAVLDAGAAAVLDLTPGPHVVIEISDTGIGMDEETRRHAFEPFFTTKRTGGTGLGLATCHGVLMQGGGRIRVESAPGAGSTFSIILPRSEEASAPVKVESGEKPKRAHGTETVLVAEDESSVRTLAERLLELDGYRVLAASNGAEALRVAAAHAGPIDLLLTDIVMPGMSGWDLGLKLRALRPDVVIVAMSGYPGGTDAGASVETLGASFLPKPFSRDALARAVREALDRRG